LLACLLWRRYDRAARRRATDVDQWGWACGFYPRRQHAEGTAASFEDARVAFEAAWEAYLPGCADADFAKYRRHRAWTRWKYEMHETGTSC
jgi:hypothetical protein